MHESTDEVLRELDAIQRSAGRGVLDVNALHRAASLVEHPDNHVRWQALIAVAGWIETSPDEVWKVVLMHGQSEDEDMRSGVATVLLEHLLEHHVATYLPLLRERIQDGAPLLKDTLGKCWPFGQAEARWDEVLDLLAED